MEKKKPSYITPFPTNQKQNQKQSADRERLPEDPDRKPMWKVTLSDKAALTEFYRQQVFQPDIPMPTVSLAEYADYEMERIREQEEQKQLPAVDLVLDLGQRGGRQALCELGVTRKRD